MIAPLFYIWFLEKRFPFLYCCHFVNLAIQPPTLKRFNPRKNSSSVSCQFSNFSIQYSLYYYHFNAFWLWTCYFFFWSISIQKKFKYCFRARSDTLVRNRVVDHLHSSSNRVWVNELSVKCISVRHTKNHIFKYRIIITFGRIYICILTNLRWNYHNNYEFCGLSQIDVSAWRLKHVGSEYKSSLNAKFKEQCT